MLLGDVLSWSCVFNLGDAFQARANRARFARLLLRNEPSPAYPYRIFYYVLHHKRLSRL